MRTIRRRVMLQRAQLTQFATVCEQLSKCETSKVRGDVRASTLREFKLAMERNRAVLSQQNDFAMAACESLYDAEKMQAFADGADKIKRAFAVRDARGFPKTVRDESTGAEHYDIPANKRDKLSEALAKYDADHPDIAEMRAKVDAFALEKVPVILTAVPFRSIPCEVNGAYMAYIDEITFARPIRGFVGWLLRPVLWLFGA